MKFNHFILFVCLIGLTGCSPGIRQSWYDFRAYYNTFYNALQYYEAGLNSHENQQPEINPELPIRIHIPPSGTGSEDFDRAIETATDVLQRHSRSRYGDRALEIIGRSYYYKEDYYMALETFLGTYDSGTDPSFRQNAIIWEGRTYIEMGAPGEGLEILGEKLDSGVMEAPEKKAELLLVIAQLYSALEDYELAAETLAIAVNEVQDIEMRARALFLLGQLYKFTDQPEKALEVFGLVLENRPSFELEYHSRRVMGEIFRDVKRYSLALEQFRDMQRDDKFRNRLPEIVYEIARTEHLGGDPASAVTLYNTVLRNSDSRPDALTLTKVYYSMAEVQKNVYGDLQMAAAYYDSAYSQQVSAELLPVEWSVEESAYGYGEYADIRHSLSEIETLLELGMMSPEERQDAMEVIRRGQEQLGVAAGQQTQQFTESIPGEALSGTTDGGNTFGFLNINNPVLLESGRREFRSYWGERPLIDDWRRSSVAFGTRQNNLLTTDIRGGDESEVGMEIPDQQAPNFSSDIPVTAEDQKQMRGERNELYFQLGNVFLMNLQLPDSAGFYFQKVLESGDSEELKARALYGLAEVALKSNDSGLAESLRNRLIEEYPDSEAAIETVNRSGGRVDTPARADSVQIRYSSIMTDSLSAQERAGKLHQLALDYENDPRSARILLDAASAYLRIENNLANSESVFRDSARAVLTQLDLLFPESSENSRGELLRQEISPGLNDEMRPADSGSEASVNAGTEGADTEDEVSEDADPEDVDIENTDIEGAASEDSDIEDADTGNMENESRIPENEGAN